MAKVSNPLFSTGASGSIAEEHGGITFSSWKGISYAKTKITENNSSSTAQVTERSYFSMAVAAWQAESSTTQGLWNTYIKNANLAMSGFNLYMRKYIEFLVAHSGTPPTVTNTPPVMS